MSVTIGTIASELLAELAPAVVLGGGVPDSVLHTDLVIVSCIRVTVPLRASSRPSMETPSATVIDVRAMTVPAKLEPDPRVAELVTCRKTLQGWAPRVNLTDVGNPPFAARGCKP
jgi:hypothetical protein